VLKALKYKWYKILKTICDELEWFFGLRSIILLEKMIQLKKTQKLEQEAKIRAYKEEFDCLLSGYLFEKNENMTLDAIKLREKIKQFLLETRMAMPEDFEKFWRKENE